MSNDLGEAGTVFVSSFCGPEGRRESYQLTQGDRWVTFTWDELCSISDLIERAHAQRKGEDLGMLGPGWDSMTGSERACFARGLLSGMHTAASAFLKSPPEIEAFMTELRERILKERPDAR